MTARKSLNWERYMEQKKPNKSGKTTRPKKHPDRIKPCKKCGEEKSFQLMYSDTQCKDCRNAGRRSRYREDSKYREKQNSRSIVYYRDNKPAIKEVRVKYRASEHYKKTRQARQKQILKENGLEALKTRIRKAVGMALSRRGYIKTGRTHQYLGCTYDEAIRHLVMTWEFNYPDTELDWKLAHIDHIIPLAIAKTEAEVVKLNHYTNLQLLKAEDNLKKGASWQQSEI